MKKLKEKIIRKGKKQPLPADFKTLRLNYQLATWFYSGRLPMAGTMGTLASLPFGWAILHAWGTIGLAIATVIVTFVGIYVSNWYEAETKTHDASEIVIDEVAGMWLTALLLPTSGEWLLPWVIAFAYFRIFDWTKPWPACFFEKGNLSGLGVMMDDIVAGAYAFIATYFTLQIMGIPL